MPAPYFLMRNAFLTRNARAAAAALAALVLASAAASTCARAQGAPKPHLTGFWQSYSDDGDPSGWFYFYEKNGLYEGRLVKMFKKKGETTLVQTCTACPGDKKNTPMLGLVIVYNLKHHGDKFESGNILDPRDGSVYNAEAEVSPDGEKLLLRGYLGLELFGQTQTWTRLPDNSMATADIPGEPVAPKTASGAAKPASAAKPAHAKPPHHAAPAPKPDSAAPAANPDAAAPAANPEGAAAQ